MGNVTQGAVVECLSALKAPGLSSGDDGQAAAAVPVSTGAQHRSPAASTRDRGSGRNRFDWIEQGSRSTTSVWSRSGMGRTPLFLPMYHFIQRGPASRRPSPPAPSGDAPSPPQCLPNSGVGLTFRQPIGMVVSRRMVHARAAAWRNGDATDCISDHPRFESGAWPPAFRRAGPGRLVHGVMLAAGPRSTHMASRLTGWSG